MASAASDAENFVFSHLTGFISEPVKVVTRCTGYCRHLAHGRIKISGSFHRRRAKSYNASRYRKKLRSGIADIMPPLSTKCSAYSETEIR